jgi:hypothetical protein
MNRKPTDTEVMTSDQKIHRLKNGDFIFGSNERNVALPAGTSGRSSSQFARIPAPCSRIR